MDDARYGAMASCLLTFEVNLEDNGFEGCRRAISVLRKCSAFKETVPAFLSRLSPRAPFRVG